MAKPWRFILRSKLRGEVELLNEPQNWRDRETKLVRDMKTYGITREITSPIQFIRDGYAYVRDCFNQGGFGAEVNLEVFEWNTQTRRYDTYFSGELIMKTVDMEPTVLTVLATPSGVASLLKDKADKKVDLETAFNLQGAFVFTTPLTLIQMRSFGITRRFRGNWVTPQKTYGLTAGQLLQIGFDEIIVDELPGIIKERATIGSSQVFPILKVEEGGSYRFILDFLVQVNLDNASCLSFFYRINEGTPVAVSSTFSFPRYRVSQNFTITLNKGDLFYFYANVGVNCTATLPVTASRPMPQDTWIIEADTETVNFGPFGLLAFEAMQQSLRQVTSADVTLASTALGRTDLGYAADGVAALNFITTGAGLSAKPQKLNVSFGELFESLRNLYNLGMDIVEDAYKRTTVVVEPMDYFFTGQLGVELFEVSNFRKRVAQDYIYSEVKVGFETYESELGGSEEDAHTEVSYVIPSKFVNNVLDIRSKLVGSPYLIEQKARQALKPNTKESKDDQLYIINLVRDGLGYDSARDEAFETVIDAANVETMHNLDIHPARVIKRWGSYLASQFYRNPGLLLFASAKGESTLSTKKASEPLPAVESAHINYTELGAPKWFPEVYEFECKLTTAQDKALISQKYNIVKVVDDGELYYGYLLERSRTEKNEASFTLLRANYNG